MAHFMRNRIPSAALPQLAQDAIHAGVAIVVVLCTTFLAAIGKIPADVTGAVYTGVVGYVAGRAGNVVRNVPTRKQDAGPYGGSGPDAATQIEDETAA